MVTRLHRARFRANCPIIDTGSQSDVKAPRIRRTKAAFGAYAVLTGRDDLSMCGRYATFGPVSLSREAKDVLERMDLDIVTEIHQRDDRFNIAPSQRALIVAQGEYGFKANAIRWGLLPSWATDPKIGTRTINARMETAATMPAFRNAFRRRRCLVPASGYFEWTGQAGKKQPYFIQDPTEHLLMFAGLWEAWREGEGEGEPWSQTFTIVTGRPEKVSGDIHDRQPVILPPDLWSIWFTAQSRRLAQRLQKHPRPRSFVTGCQGGKFAPQ